MCMKTQIYYTVYILKAEVLLARTNWSHVGSSVQANKQAVMVDF